MDNDGVNASYFLSTPLLPVGEFFPVSRLAIHPVFALRQKGIRFYSTNRHTLCVRSSRDGLLGSGRQNANLCLDAVSLWLYVWCGRRKENSLSSQ